MKSKISYNFIKLSFFFTSICFYAQDLDKNNYLKHIDSASNRIDNYPKIADTFLDSIPEPFEKTIKGRISEYYRLKSVISSHLDNVSEIYHYNILSLKYAEKEENYELAGAASIELFYNLYIIKKDISALNYLKKAEEYYKIAKDKFGLIEVIQMKAYIELYNKNYIKSNNIILPELEYYKTIKEDSFYYMYALFLLTTNYVNLIDEVNYKKYFTDFKNLEKDTTISKLLFKIHEVTININISKMYLGQKKTDSAFLYLKKSDALQQYMNNSDKENNFKNYVTYYEQIKDFKNKQLYIDSLKYLNESLIKKNIDASFKINNSFIKSSENLEIETSKKSLNRNWIIFLTTLLFSFIGFVFVKYKKIRIVISDFTKRTKEYSFLKNNHEKLKVKVIGLENYIVDLKKEVKRISTITNIDDQRTKIKELQKEIHHSSSILLIKGEDHLNLINELNVEFFNKISIEHPELNSSEIVICYYLFMGFKTKEIGTFIKASVRSVESKRYRIANKLNLKEKGYKLVDYLENNFKQPHSSV